MSSASDYVKFGGCLGFSAVFLLVLLKNRDIVGALLDASIACVIMALVFRQLHGLTISLEKEVKIGKTERSKATEAEQDQQLTPLTDSRSE